MSYVDNHLMQGEQVLYRARIHWVVYMPGVVFFALAAFVQLQHYVPNVPHVVPSVIALIGLFKILAAMVYVNTTEFVVTSARVIAKTGWFSHQVLELRHDKIEGLTMQQTASGVAMNYGTLVLSGTGGDKTLIPTIGDPAEFCNQAMGVITKRTS
jgi:uncharacterized membrane protein YdbT with pleckstrin-like domain